MEKKVTVKLDEKNPEPTEIIAKAIIDISEGMQKINAGKLNRKALLVLLKDSSGVSMRQIEAVLNSLAELKNTYTKK